MLIWRVKMHKINSYSNHKDCAILLLCLFMTCIISIGASQEMDSDEDGLSDEFEINISKTDPNTFSTDGDPYGDRDEYYGLNMPKISPADHPLVAAYPNIIVRLERIEVIPINMISTSTGKTKNEAWAITTETSDEEKNSNEVGAGFNTRFTATDGGLEINGHFTHIDENTHTTTNSESNSGFTEEDWGTATSLNTDRAAILKLTLSVKNTGTIPVRDIIPDVNIKLGERIIETFTSPTAIDSLDIGESKSFLVDQGVVGAYPVDITVSLDQLRSMDSGTPLSIETLQARASIKKYKEKEWVLVNYNLYMDEINKRTATLMYRSKDGTYKEYKVYAASAGDKSLLDPITLGDAINYTIGQDILRMSDELDIGFFPQEAFDESKKLADNNESIFDLKMKPGWKIFIKELGWEPIAEPPVIHWANIAEDKNLKTSVRASVTNDLGPVNVIAHVKIKGEYRDLPMVDIDQDTIYTLISNETFDPDGDHYINATNAEGYSAQLKFSSPKKPAFKDGEYVFAARNDNLYMTGDTGNNINQNHYAGGSNQIWVLTSDGTGFYSIKNSQNGKYLNGNEGDIETVQDPDSRNQWNFEPVGDGCYKICNIQSKKCLTSTEDRSIILEDYAYSDSQNWTIQLAESFPNQNFLTFNPPVDYYIIIVEPSKKCLNFDYISGAVQQWECYGELNKYLNTNQLWGLKPVGDGYFEIFSIYNRRCLEVNNSNGHQIIVENNYQGRDNQKWYFKSREDGYDNICSKVRSKNGIVCLATESGSSENGVGVVQEILRNTKSQRWKLLPVTKVAIYADVNYVRYYLQLKVTTNDQPSKIKTDNTKHELIPLGKDIGSDIVAIKNLYSSGFIHMLSYTTPSSEKKKFIRIDWLAKDKKLESKTVYYPGGGDLSLTEVLMLNDPSYQYKLDPSDEKNGTIRCGTRSIQLIQAAPPHSWRLWIEARDNNNEPLGDKQFAFDQLVFEHLT